MYKETKLVIYKFQKQIYLDLLPKQIVYTIVVLLSFTILVYLLMFSSVHTCTGRLKNAFVVATTSILASSYY